MINEFEIREKIWLVKIKFFFLQLMWDYLEKEEKGQPVNCR